MLLTFYENYLHERNIVVDISYFKHVTKLALLSLPAVLSAFLWYCDVRTKFDENPSFTSGVIQIRNRPIINPHCLWIKKVLKNGLFDSHEPWWRQLSCEEQLSFAVCLLKPTDVSEKTIACIFKVTSLKKVLFIFAVVRTRNPTFFGTFLYQPHSVCQ
jgi:hypothetical protein